MNMTEALFNVLGFAGVVLGLNLAGIWVYKILKGGR